MTLRSKYDPVGESMVHGFGGCLGFGEFSDEAKVEGHRRSWRRGTNKVHVVKCIMEWRSRRPWANTSQPVDSVQEKGVNRTGN